MDQFENGHAFCGRHRGYEQIPICLDELAPQFGVWLGSLCFVFAKSAMGIVGSETAFAVSYTALCKEHGVPVETLLELMTKGGKIIGVEYDIKEGAKADIVILDTEDKYTINSSDFVSMGKCTPFDGMEVYGRVTHTIAGGKEVYKYE